jgi:hypothetical protein
MRNRPFFDRKAALARILRNTEAGTEPAGVREDDSAALGDVFVD